MLCETHDNNEIRESGGTGRRARLRGVWISPYGFKSRFSHHEENLFCPIDKRDFFNDSVPCGNG